VAVKEKLILSFFNINANFASEWKRHNNELTIMNNKIKQKWNPTVIGNLHTRSGKAYC